MVPLELFVAIRTLATQKSIGIKRKRNWYVRHRLPVEIQEQRLSELLAVLGAPGDQQVERIR